MSRPETFEIHCDHPGCSANMGIGFACHEAAHRAMTVGGWYYDAHADLCPAHFPGEEAHFPGEEDEVIVEEALEALPVFVGGAFHAAPDAPGREV
jgi:hypothetical protein